MEIFGIIKNAFKGRKETSDLCDKKVLVLGLSKSGIAAAKLAKKRGADVYLSEGKDVSSDRQPLVNELRELGIHVEYGSHSDAFIQDSKLVVTSPGIPPHSDIIQRLKSLNIPIISELELAYRETSIPFVIITGTNGKTTTTALTEHILNKKYAVKACGNIGQPPCDLVDEDLDYFVCEASSFQLEMSPTLTPLIAVWTNFTPDHIDWHQGLENYFNAKAKIFRGTQTPDYATVLNAKDSRLAEFSKTIENEVAPFVFGLDGGENSCYIENGEIVYKKDNKPESIIRLDECPIIGEHNYQNIMCAIICAKLLQIDNETIRKAIIEFKAPPHRLEKVRTFKNITFYNDSKATNPEAAIVAINAFNGTDVALIAGGRDKNTDLTEFCESVKNHIKTVILIGEAAERFEENLLKSGFSNIIKEDTMQSAIDKAVSLQPEVVLLSPACASFDMFTGYEQRGDVFREYVLSRV
ncbi:MAG: UDP-N-acetylmuramoyl-L-alanine--D-glutamate ligase [Muribaculaceae bacterium]|nr:UDP-N-acetylmuramoyl-L-alanine--D-glutamate ligase [Muribaculaceae bacterium]